LKKLLDVPKNQVMTSDGVYCSNVSPEYETSSYNFNFKSNYNYSIYNFSNKYSWFVLPDYVAVQSTFQKKLESEMVAGFTNKLFAFTTNPYKTFPMVLSFSYFVPGSANAAIPSINELNSSISIFETYILFNITLSNSSGYLYWGVGGKNSTKPLGRILRDGNDGNGFPLVQAGRKYIPERTTVSFIAPSGFILNATDYKLFIALSSDDPGPEATFSDVIEKVLHRLEANFSRRNIFRCLIVGLLIWFTVFVI
jgi:hypothetical protein